MNPHKFFKAEKFKSLNKTERIKKALKSNVRFIESEKKYEKYTEVTYSFYNERGEEFGVLTAARVPDEGRSYINGGFTFSEEDYDEKDPLYVEFGKGYGSHMYLVAALRESLGGFKAASSDSSRDAERVWQRFVEIGLVIQLKPAQPETDTLVWLPGKYEFIDLKDLYYNVSEELPHDPTHPLS